MFTILRRKIVSEKDVPGEIEAQQCVKLDQTAVGMNSALKIAIAEVEGDNMACGIVTGDTFPGTTICIWLPRS